MKVELSDDVFADNNVVLADVVSEISGRSDDVIRDPDTQASVDYVSDTINNTYDVIHDHDVNHYDEIYQRQTDEGL